MLNVLLYIDRYYLSILGARCANSNRLAWEVTISNGDAFGEVYILLITCSSARNLPNFRTLGGRQLSYTSECALLSCNRINLKVFYSSKSIYIYLLDNYCVSVYLYIGTYIDRYWITWVPDPSLATNLLTFWGQMCLTLNRLGGGGAYHAPPPRFFRNNS